MLKRICNKKGSEMIEAAIVLPLLFLAVVSLMYLSIFFQDVFKEQIDVQRTLLYEYYGDDAVFSVLSEGTVVERTSAGLFGGAFRKEYEQRIFVINEEKIIRGGKVIGAVKDEQ